MGAIHMASGQSLTINLGVTGRQTVCLRKGGAESHLCRGSPQAMFYLSRKHSAIFGCDRKLVLTC